MSTERAKQKQPQQNIIIPLKDILSSAKVLSQSGIAHIRSFFYRMDWRYGCIDHFSTNIFVSVCLKFKRYAWQIKQSEDFMVASTGTIVGVSKEMDCFLARHSKYLMWRQRWLNSTFLTLPSLIKNVEGFLFISVRYMLLEKLLCHLCSPSLHIIIMFNRKWIKRHKGKMTSRFEGKWKAR